MNIRELEKKVDKFNLSVYPQMLVQIQKVTADEYSSAQDLSEIILKDQSLTSKILSVANSAYYGFYGKVSTITQAIVVLGFESVKNIALGLTAYNSLSAFVKDPCVKQFWEHSLATGVCAELLAEKLGYVPTEEALVAGLIHDVGKLLLIQFYPEEYQEVEKVRSEHNAYSHLVEASILGVTHCDAGRLLANKWGLPPALISALSDHHKKAWGANPLTDIVAFSDFIIQALAERTSGEGLDQLINMGSTVLSLKKESINAVLQILAERLEEYCRIFEIRVDNLMAYTTMIEQEYARLKKNPLTRELSKKEEEVSILSEISNALIAGRPQNEIFQMVLEGLIRLEGASAVIVFIADHRQAAIRCRMGLGKNATQFCSSFSVLLSDQASSVVQALSTGGKQYIDASSCEAGGPSQDRMLLSGLQAASAYILPLMMQDRALGALLIAWESVKAEKEESELQSMLLFANQASLILSTAAKDTPAAESPRRRRSSLLLDID